MKRFVRTMFICFIVLALLCSAVVLIGRAHPDVSILADLSVCGESLCYLGILPGKTAWREGMTLIQSNPNLRLERFSISAYQRIDQRYRLIVLPTKEDDHPDPRTISDIDLGNFNPSVQIGDIFSLLGLPCDVFKVDAQTLQFGYYDAIVIVEDNALTPTSLVRSITLTENYNRFCVEGIAENNTRFSAWHGFRQYHFR